ncbi:MAG: hypothetical protein OXH50_03935 [Gemmatimonadetes bacterium]|nr:hypothetical protein [Gemmatimonadota bacterium]
MLKRGYHGVYPRMSPEHLHAMWPSSKAARDEGTLEQMRPMARGFMGKRLKFRDLIRHDHGHQATAT